MDCNTARQLGLVRGHLNSELPAEDAHDLDRHFETCGDCQRVQSIERKLDEPIARAMKSVTVPVELKSKILNRLATQRGAYYRRRVFFATAAAASVLIAVGLLTWRPVHQEKLDLNAIVSDGGHYVENPRETVGAWLSAQGIQYRPPVPLNPRLLAYYGMTTIQGKQVPTLNYGFDFTEGPALCVFVIRDVDFDVKAIPDNFSGSSAQGYHVEIYHDREQPNKLAYVILFKGDSLAPFLSKFVAT